MIRAEFGDSLSGFMNRIHKGFSDLRPLAKPIGQIMLDGNRTNLGTDWHGNGLSPVLPSTIKRGRGGDGPPLAPHGQNSRIVTNAQINAAGTGDYLVVEMSWNLPWLKYHTTGTRYMAQRDITGIRPDTMDQIDACISNYFDDLVSFEQGNK